MSLCAMVAFCLPLFPPTVARAQQTSQQPPAPVVNGPLVQDLAFLSGRWRGGVAGGVFDEEWSDPSANSMMGMFRYTESSKVKFYEFMVIEATASGPVLRLRHFDPGLVPWEEPNKPASLPVVGFTENQVIFESTDKALRLTYRLPSADSLTVVLEEGAAPGRKGRQEFHFGRLRGIDSLTPGLTH